MIRLADLAGPWRLEREIIDARAGLTGRFTGEACWSRQGEGMRQAERGELIFGAADPMRAERAYLWSESQGRLAVHFDDGRPFHEFDADARAPEAEHLCGPDLYQVAYQFREWPTWSSRWIVSGPRKQLTILNRFSRADQ